MFDIQISPDLRIASGKLSKLGTDLVSQIMNEIGPSSAVKFESALKRNVPVRSGTGRESLQVVATQGARGRSATLRATGASHLKYVIGGTRPHEIHPRNGRFLSFVTKDGNLVFARSVNHPGTSPNNFVERAWKEAGPQIISDIRSTGARAWRDLARFK